MNTQPWSRRIDDATIGLDADHSRQQGDLVLGWAAAVDRFPNGATSALLARLTLSWVGTSDHTAAGPRSIGERRAGRRRLESWRVHDCTRDGLSVVPLVEVVEVAETRARLTDEVLLDDELS